MSDEKQNSKQWKTTYFISVYFNKNIQKLKKNLIKKHTIMFYIHGNK